MLSHRDVHGRKVKVVLLFDTSVCNAVVVERTVERTCGPIVPRLIPRNDAGSRLSTGSARANEKLRNKWLRIILISIMAKFFPMQSRGGYVNGANRGVAGLTPYLHMQAKTTHTKKSDGSWHQAYVKHHRLELRGTENKIKQSTVDMTTRMETQ